MILGNENQINSWWRVHFPTYITITLINSKCTLLHHSPISILGNNVICQVLEIQMEHQILRLNFSL